MIHRFLRFKERSRCKANLTIEVKDAKTGETLEIIKVHNLTVTTGKNLIRDRLKGNAVNALTHFAVGTSSTAPAVGQTALVTEVFRDQITQFVDGSATLTVKYYLATGYANGNTLREAGLFNAASTGTMYARAIYTAIAKTSSVAVTYSWDLTWS